MERFLENSEILTLKFDVDLPSNITKVLDLKSAIADILGLKSCALRLVSIKEGCVVVKFCILQVLNLGWNNVGSDGAKALAEGL